MHISDDELVGTLSQGLPGGPLLAAVYARVETAASWTRMLTPLGNYLIARPAARAKAHQVTEETDVPLDAAMVLGLTATDLHIWSADIMLGQVHDHLGAVPRTAIADVEIGVAKILATAHLKLNDGHTIEVEARGGVHQFATCFKV